MIYKKEYSTETERQHAIDDNQDKILIEEQNISEGNFLIFTDTPRIEDNIQEIRNSLDILILKQEGII